MWRKPTEAKPSPQSSEPSATSSVKPAAVAPVATQTAQHTSVPAAASPVVSATPSAASTPSASSFASAPATAPRGATRISAGIRIKGEVSGSDDVYIDGQAEGQFRFPQSKVTVGPNGRLQASIEAREIVIEGTVEGNLKASASVHLGASSRVTSCLTTARIAIEDGARLRGKVEMTRASGSKQDASASTAVISTPKIESHTSETPQVSIRAAGE
ncbi:MAG: bactofilin family protein [Candidatus Acidiferrales bacterium]